MRRGIHTLYDVLGVEPDAPPEKIQAIYRLRSRSAHPRRPGEGNPELQQQLNEAYRILRDHDLREAYNLEMGLPRQPRAILPGKSIYIEVQAETTSEILFVPCTFTRWEPCSRCWGEGCMRCGEKGRTREKVQLEVKVLPHASEVLIEGEGSQSEPGGSRGDLVIYVIRK